MRRGLVPRVVVPVLAAALLGACGGADDAADDERDGWQTVTATDDAFSVQVPPEWTVREQYLNTPVVVAVQGADRADQVLVSSYDDEVRAEDEAISSSGILSGSNVFCERLDATEVFGEPRLVFDCPVQKPGEPTLRKIFVPFADEERSALMLVQTEAETLEETADLVRPVLESWSWE